MKNLILLSVLITLIVTAYFVEERGDRNRKIQIDLETKLLDLKSLGSVKEFAVRDARVIIKNGLFFTGKHHKVADARKINHIFSVLAGIRAVRAFTDEEIKKLPVGIFTESSPYFEFLFEKGSAKFVIGKKLDFSQSFYIKIVLSGKSRILIAKDDGSGQGFVKKGEEHRASYKHDRLVAISKFGESYFYDLRVFRNLGAKVFRTVKVENFRNRAFLVNNFAKSTIPGRPVGIDYDLTRFRGFFQTLRSLEGIRILFPYKSGNLKKKVSKITYQFESEEDERTLFLYRKYGNESGYFLQAEGYDVIFELIGDMAKIFFYNMQEFWDLKAIHKLKEKTAFGLFFPGRGEIDMALDESKGFKVSHKGSLIPRGVAFKKLLTMMRKMRGDHVSTYSGKRKIVESFRINIDGKKFSVGLYSGDLLFVNKEKKYIIHYYVGREAPIGLKYSDYFVTD